MDDSFESRLNSLKKSASNFISETARVTKLEKIVGYLTNYFKKKRGL